MSGAEPASKEARPDSDRQPLISNPVFDTGGDYDNPSSGAIAAYQSAGDTATSTMLGQPSLWARTKAKASEGLAAAKTDLRAVAGLESVVAEIVHTAHHNTKTGDWEATVDIGKALYWIQTLSSNPELHLVTLNGATRGTNPVQVKINIDNKSFELDAPVLQIAAFSAAGVSGKSCELHGVVVRAKHLDQPTIRFTSASLHDVTMIKAGQQLGVREIDLRGLWFHLSAGAGGKDTHLYFSDAKLQGLMYPHQPPVDLELGGGTSLDAV